MSKLTTQDVELLVWGGVALAGLYVLGKIFNKAPGNNSGSNLPSAYTTPCGTVRDPLSVCPIYNALFPPNNQCLN